MTARIAYLAVLCAEPAMLAGFYVANFGLTEIGRSAEGDVTLSDGGFNLTLFRNRGALHEPHSENGLHHLGVAVDNVEAVVARYRARYPRGTVVAESGDLQHGAVRIYDPECHPVSLSQTRFGLPPVVSRVPRIAHFALNALDTEAIRDFFVEIFGLREVFEAHAKSRERPGYSNKHVRRRCPIAHHHADARGRLGFDGKLARDLSAYPRRRMARHLSGLCGSPGVGGGAIA